MRFRPPYKSQRSSVSSKMHDCTAQHNSISIKVYFLERVAPLLLALALFWLWFFWEVAPLNINLNGEIQRDEVSILWRNSHGDADNALCCRKAELLLCDEDKCLNSRVWLVGSPLWRIFKKPWEQPKAWRHTPPLIWCETMMRGCAIDAVPLNMNYYSMMLVREFRVGYDYR